MKGTHSYCISHSWLGVREATSSVPLDFIPSETLAQLVFALQKKFEELHNKLPSPEPFKWDTSSESSTAGCERLLCWQLVSRLFHSQFSFCFGRSGERVKPGSILSPVFASDRISRSFLITVS